MTRDPHATMFLERFNRLFTRLRRVRTGTALCLASFSLVIGTTLLAACDYRWELDTGVRRILLTVMAGGVAILLVRYVWMTLRRWNRPTTAAELEARFPDLGQRVRTTLQYGPESTETVRAEGAAPMLVQALAADTDVRTQPLELDLVVPARRFQVAAGVLAAAAIAFLFGYSMDWEWRTAVRRALFADTPYTVVAIEPGNTSVVDGGSLNVRLGLRGRTNRQVVLMTRPEAEGDAAWSEQTLEAASTRSEAPQSVTLETRLARITEPLVYRVVANNSRGKTVAESPVFQIGVRYLLAIRSVETTITPPDYTGLAAKTFQDGSVTALRGSRAAFRISLDRAPATAALRVTPRGRKSDESRAPQIVDLNRDGAVLTAELPLDEDFDWSLIAQSFDGTPLPENAFRVRTHEDRPPQVSFTEPSDALEVHTLAEVVMQARVTDDYGVTRSGIVFQINSDDEHTLLEEDFAKVVEAADELVETGGVTPRTRATLERLLPLEHFGLTQKDCVVYYAFAEDNYPLAPHRSETDLRFIDIRPFKTIYRMPDPEENQPNPEQRPELASLGELIRRQRYALNRSIRLQKLPDRWADSELNTIDRLIEYQTDVARGTRELAEALESRGSDVADVLFQAEAAMLGAVDSLSIGRHDTAVLQEKDAQQRLVEARERLDVVLGRNRGLAAAMRAVDRRLVQKIRHTRDEEEERRKERVVQRLVQLAMNEAGVAQSLAGMSEAGGSGGGDVGDQETTTEPSGKKTDERGETGQPNEPSKETDAANAAQDPDNPERGSSEPGPSPDPQSRDTSDEKTMPEHSKLAGRHGLEEVQDRQADLAVEAGDLTNILQNLEGVTELAKERMKAAAEAVNAASADLNRNDIPAARTGTGAAAEQLREVARQVAGLLAGETSQQVAAARDVAAELSFRERDLANALETPERAASIGGKSPPKPGTEETNPTAGIGNDRAVAEARRLFESTRTLQDLMKAIADTKNSTSAEAVDQVSAVLSRGEIKMTVERIQRIPEVLKDNNPPKQAVLDVRESADRMEATARELDRLYRSIVMPRIEQLKEMEQRVARLQQQMTQLQSMNEAREWEQGAAELTEKLEQEGMGGDARKEMQELIAGGGDSIGGLDTRWVVGSNGFLVPGARYVTNLRLLVEVIQQHIEELLLADLQGAADEATPPAYQQLVERYLQVLAKEAKSQ